MTAHDATSRKPAYHHGDLRQALLTAAEVELAEKGVERFTLRGVAKRAGVSHAAPAHHFKDTDAMLTALAVVAAERFSRSLSDRQSRAAPDPRSQFVASGIGYVEFALKSPTLFRLMFGSDRPDSDDPDLNRHANDAFMNLVDGIAAISGGNPMESDRGLQDIAAAWSVVHGMASLLIAGRMAFIRPLLDADFDGTLEGIVGRIVR